MKRAIRTFAAPGNTGNRVMTCLLLGTAAAVALYRNRAMAEVVRPMESSQTVAARQVIADYLNGQHENVADLQQKLQSADHLIESCLTGRSYPQVPLAEVRNNPFRQNLAASSLADTAVNSEKTDAARVTMLQNLQKLQLQSIVTSGDHPACMIDNRFYREGEQVDGFTIERIEEGEVVVRSGEYRFELKIAG